MDNEKLRPNSYLYASILKMGWNGGWTQPGEGWVGGCNLGSRVVICSGGGG